MRNKIGKNEAQESVTVRRSSKTPVWSLPRGPESSFEEKRRWKVVKGKGEGRVETTGNTASDAEERLVPIY